MKFVFDLDGTICFSGKPLSTKMVQALDFIVQNGHEVVFASARPIRDLLPVLPTSMHQCSMVGGNGAFVAKEGSILSTIHFDKEIAESLMGLINKFEADYLIDSQWDYAYSGDDDHPIRRNLDPEQRAQNRRIEELNENVKVVILRSLEPQHMLNELQKLPIVTYMHGSENIIDVSPHGVDKWAGLQALGVQPQEYIAFGNDANDVSMFRHAKRSICVGDHVELVQMATEKVLNDEQEVIKKIIALAVELGVYKLDY
ncbi:HAD-IIB family hydrolase [Paenibacillus sp. 481]|uniref:HAD-IIB family hydrolase n=1 Tax=Paenibacillus sp. 481 TaxID=2835869 RepID=UPI001E2B6107|nr:HAD family hydrolase [Paenibacillus sp. 481]UHA73425.1 HAD family phosphatase [Paenibacillus sp. 481]